MTENVIIVSREPNDDLLTTLQPRHIRFKAHTKYVSNIFIPDESTANRNLQHFNISQKSTSNLFCQLFIEDLSIFNKFLIRVIIVVGDKELSDFKRKRLRYAGY